MARHELMQGAVEGIPVGCERISIGEIGYAALRFVIGRCRATFRLLMERIPAAFEIGRQRREIRLAFFVACCLLSRPLFFLSV